MNSRQPKRKSSKSTVKSLQDKDITTGLIGGEVDMTKRRKIERNPLFMEEIVEIIFSFLDVDSIKSARQVHNIWSGEGAKILLSKCYVQISSDLQRRVSLRRNQTISKLKDFLSHKSKIPKITVKSFSDVELWKSLGVLGPQVSSLKLKYIDDDEAKLLHNLLDLLPNLKYLSMSYDDYSGFYSTGVAIIRVFNSIRSKAERTQNLVISTLSVGPEGWDEMEDVEKFAELNRNIMVEELLFWISEERLREIVPDIDDRAINIAGKIESTSKNIIKTLDVYNID